MCVHFGSISKQEGKFTYLSHTSSQHTNQSKPVAEQLRVMTLWQINLLKRNVKKYLISICSICNVCMLTMNKKFDAFSCTEIRAKKHLSDSNSPRMGQMCKMWENVTEYVVFPNLQPCGNTVSHSEYVLYFLKVSKHYHATPNLSSKKRNILKDKLYKLRF